MNSRGIILIVVAITLSLLTIWMVRGWLLSTQNVQIEQSQPQVSGPQVLVAKNNLPIGHIVTAQDFETVSWPDEDHHDSYLVGQTSAENLVGQVVRHGILAGEPITHSRFIAAGSQGFMAAILSPGMRAVTVAVDRTSGIAGFIFPGDRVDLILTHQVGNMGEQARFVSETFLKNARVLAVDTKTNDIEDVPELSKTVTIEVTPQIAERINVVLRMGTISLSLRSISKPDGVVTSAMSRDQNMPSISSPTITWDSDVSTILPPVGKSNNGPSVIITRGASNQKVDIEGAN